MSAPARWARLCVVVLLCACGAGSDQPLAPQTMAAAIARARLAQADPAASGQQPLSAGLSAQQPLAAPVYQLAEVLQAIKDAQLSDPRQIYLAAQSAQISAAQIDSLFNLPAGSALNYITRQGWAQLPGGAVINGMTLAMPSYQAEDLRQLVAESVLQDPARIHEFAVTAQLSAAQIDAMFRLASGTVAAYVSSQGWAALNGGATATGLNPSGTVGGSMMDGAFEYGGAAPALTSIDYRSRAGESLNAPYAYSGFVQVSIDPVISRDAANIYFATLGGTAVEGIPLAGIYLVNVPAGRESTFISAVFARAWVLDAQPASAFDIAASGINMYALDNFSDNPNVSGTCGRTHGAHVKAVMSRTGGSVEEVSTFSSALLSLFNGGDWNPFVARQMLRRMHAAYQADRRAVINISLQPKASGSAGAAQDRRNCTTGVCREIQEEQKLFFRTLLQSMEQTTKQYPAVADNSLIVVSAGNAGVDLTRQLQDLVAEFPNAAQRVVIVGGSARQSNGTDTVEPRLNSATANMIFARGVDAIAGDDLCSGTSFAAPEIARVLNDIWQREPHLTSDRVLRDLKRVLGSDGIVPQDANGVTTWDFITRVLAQSAATASAPNYTLSTRVRGTGSGSITANPPGSSFAAGTVVSLTATPASGSTFSGWSGACSGAGACTLTMNANLTVTASFGVATVQTPACSYSYSEWSTCVSGQQSRSVLSTTPAACTGSPVLTQSCTSAVSSACYYCRFDLSCSAFGAGGCWRCNSSTVTNGTCQAPSDALTYYGSSCKADPDLFQVCQ